MVMKCISREEGFTCFEIFTAAYADHTQHGALSQAKPLDMGSTGPQQG
jgi:hypothetical protein